MSRTKPREAIGVIRPRRRRKPAAYWTRERVIDGLRRFYTEIGEAPTSSKWYHDLRANRRQYPWSGVILQHWPSMRAAWRAVGVEIANRRWGRWTEIEEWYIREAVGILSYDEIAADMGRSVDGVKQRAWHMGISRFNTHGWTPWGVVKAGVNEWRLRRAIKAGEVPTIRGRGISWIDPVDLVGVAWVNWERVSDELIVAARYGLIVRLVSILATRL